MSAHADIKFRDQINFVGVFTTKCEDSIFVGRSIFHPCFALPSLLGFGPISVKEKLYFLQFQNG